VIGQGSAERLLRADEIAGIVREAFDALPLDGRRVLVVIPDGTRTMPMPMMADLLEQVLAPRVAALDYLVALGTHQPMSDVRLTALLGRPIVNGCMGRSRVFNHAWQDPATFVTLGTIPACDISGLSGGRMAVDVPVTLNRLILDYDQLVICGPVFPHEVVGFSGGNKYLVPGIAGPGIIDFTHWLGALITSASLIGEAATEVRAVIDRAASMVDRPVACLALVLENGGVSGLYAGAALDAWRAAATLSARLHVEYVERPFTRVVSVMPVMYDDLWTAAKGMYKVEPAVADGGEVIIVAPHISEVSYTHGRLLDEIGYHCRDYFLAGWDRFKGYPGGVLAHSTHLKGAGTYDPATRRERARVSVTLATGIPPERCARLNLGYRDPSSIRLEDYLQREHEGVLVLPRAGERLYRLRQ
jgi:nickel-dependent lactate racemase